MEKEVPSGEVLLLFSNYAPPFLPHAPITVQGNREDKAYHNGEHSKTIAKYVPNPLIAVPLAKFEQAQSYYYGGFVGASPAMKMVPYNAYGDGQAPRVALPSELAEKERIYYVNAKQYHAILRRRLSRAKAEGLMRERARKAYLHESRHLHAMRRARGCGGRFLNTKTLKPQT